MPKKPTFEDKIAEIDQEIAKRRNKWNLNALSWIDFDDISQILRIHIYKKWHLYDHSKPLPPWLNRTISNQLKNLIRNNYSSFARPCLRCAAAEPDNLCKIYSTQNPDRFGIPNLIDNLSNILIQNMNEGTTLSHPRAQKST